MKNKEPYVSIVVCTYNGEKRIEDCLISLLNQNYPKKKYEIIVVDDDSKDKTAEIVSRYPARLIRHKKNLGRYYARNTGLRNAKGEIIVYTDDDCIADKEWIKNLVNPYRDNYVIAVGGSVEPFYLNTITEIYLAENGYGNPLSIEFAKNKSPFYRFWVYLKNRIFKDANSKKKVFQVSDIYANASFRKEIFKIIGQWDTDLEFRGDTELCSRINEKLKNKKIMFNPNAIIVHKHKIPSVAYLLKDTYLRGEYTLINYKKNKKFPPIFPFPIFTIFAVVLCSFFNIFYGALSLILLPQVLYFWWPIKFFRKLKAYYLLFPYMQLSLELATILGLLRGYIKSKSKSKSKNENHKK